METREVIQQAVYHFLIVAVLLLLLTGVGEAAQRLLSLRRPEGSPLTQFAFSTLCGLALAQIFSTVLLTYGSLPVATVLARLAFYAGVGSGLLVFASQVRNGSALKLGGAAKTLGLLMALFLSAYFPFLPATKPFLASEGSGDHTIYLGAAKFLQSASAQDAVAAPRLSAVLTKGISVPPIQDSLWLKSALGRFDKGFDSRLSSSPFEFESAERVILLGWNPGTWSMPWMTTLGLKRLTPETVYMSLIMVLDILVCLGLMGTLEFTAPGSGFFKLAAACFLNLSAGFMSIGYNHYYPQLLAIAASVGLFLYFSRELQAESGNAGNDLVAFSLFCGGGVAQYWPNSPWIIAILVSYLALRTWRVIGRHGAFTLWPSVRQVAAAVVLVFPLLPHYLSSLMGALTFVMSFQGGNQWEAIMGKPVQRWNEGLSPLLGLLSHNHLPPFTSLVFDRLWGARLAILFFASLLVVLGAATLAHLRSVRIRKCPKPFAAGHLFSVATVFLMAFVTYRSRGYAYSFDKAALNSVPFLVIAGVGSGGMLFFRFRNSRWAQGLAVFALLWGACLFQLRSYQIGAFWTHKYRTSIVHTDVGTSPSATQEVPHVFYYGTTNTSFSILETILAGQRPVPIGQYWFPNYRAYIESLDQSRFVIPQPDRLQYQTVDAAYFRISGTPETCVWPMSPYLDMFRTHLPGLVYLDRPQYLELFVKGASPLLLSCLVASDDFKYGTREAGGSPQGPLQEIAAEAVPQAERLFTIPQAHQKRFLLLRPQGGQLIRLENVLATKVSAFSAQPLGSRLDRSGLR